MFGRKVVQIIPEYSLSEARKILERLEEIDSPTENLEVNALQSVIEGLTLLIEGAEATYEDHQEVMIPTNYDSIVIMRNAQDMLNPPEEPQTMWSSIMSAVGFIRNVFHRDADVSPYQANNINNEDFTDPIMPSVSFSLLPGDNPFISENSSM